MWDRSLEDGRTSVAASGSSPGYAVHVNFVSALLTDGAVHAYLSLFAMRAIVAVEQNLDFLAKCDTAL